MPNETYSEAIKEAMASGKMDDVVLSTLHVHHDSLSEELWLVRNNEDLTLTLEDDSTQLFEAVGFQVQLPETGTKGLQELSVQIDNVNQRALDFVSEAKAAGGPIRVDYRVYLASDLTQPQNDPPMKLTLVDVVARELRINATAKFANVLNNTCPKLIYTLARFTSL